MNSAGLLDDLFLALLLHSERYHERSIIKRLFADAIIKFSARSSVG